jgi:hypothetical protein
MSKHSADLGDRFLTTDCTVLFGHSLFYTNAYEPDCFGDWPLTKPEPENAENDTSMYFNRASLQDLDQHFYTRRPLTFGQELPQSLEELSISECTSPILGYMAELFLFDEANPKSLKTVTVSER